MQRVGSTQSPYGEGIYGQSTAKAAQSEGAFSLALQKAQAADAGAAAPTASGNSLTALLSGLLPLTMSGTGEGSKAMLILLMAALAGGGLWGDTSARPSTGGGLGALGDLGALGGFDGGGLFSLGGLSGLSGGSAPGGAYLTAAQSLMKAYRNVSAGVESAYPTTAYFAAAAPAAPAMEKAVGSDKAPGRRVTPMVASAVGYRNPDLYRSVIDQFDVVNNPRYAVNQKGAGDTYCNIFMWDVTAAMGAEIPHYTDKQTGAPAKSGDDNVLKMTANRISDWLNNFGPQHGWYEVTAEQAQALANRGCPAVTAWRNNTGGHGHVQVVSPSADGKYDPARGVAVAQAGVNLRNYTYIRKLYSSRMREVQYFAHR